MAGRFVNPGNCEFADNRSTVNIHNLRSVAKELGETMSADELREMLERAASNGEEITPPQ